MEEIVNDLLDFNNLKIVQCNEYFNFSLDSVLLANFIKINPTTRNVIDIGTGNAPILLILSTKVNEKVKLTGNKLNDKMYYNHSGYTGGLRVRSAKVMKEKYPEEMIERAVKGMLPKGRLGRQMYKKLFVYAGTEHKHSAQKPVEMKIN